MRATLQESTAPNDATFADVTDKLREVLDGQRGALARLGVELSPSGSSDLSQIGYATSDQRLQLVDKALEEIALRQATLDKALSLTPPDRSGIALDAYVAACHRISTNLDVALACAEEVIEITDSTEIASIAKQGARALRLVYHRTNELAALAQLAGGGLEPSSVEAVCCHRLLDRVVEQVRPIANDAGVRLEVLPSNALAVAQCDQALLRQTLTYLLVTAIEGSGVHTVQCGIQVTRGDIQFFLEDNAPAATLEQHASALTCATDTSDRVTPDAAGYAVVRRLARLLGGRIEIASAQCTSQTILFVPTAESKNAVG